ncbi:MAG: hypothetical protein UR93_C0005G0021 [Berkelbacteria bacterium GW2011_GWA2_35_9]|uniref:Uncharacterized protein n=1 Tax=Berkelbacteria bacterium GW2011_GWA2_35_9 TaxID=1618333 RepID=A0A0G0FNC5_9BACT|nr:MAG: hypothetical protein UR93_C0005G0021 [Berkelbacteria bacterium GW2011_GWA2_35_9]
MKTYLWIVVIILVLGLVGGGVYVFGFRSRNSDNNPTNLASEPSNGTVTKFIQADFIDLDKIFSVSKFRSGSGHDFSGNGETCRSMKHYFAPNWSQAGENLRQANNGMPPAPNGTNDINIYSPVDGTITGIKTEKSPIGEQIYIQPDSQKDYTIRLFHVYKNTGIEKGSKLTAGQKIGVIGQYSTTDIAVQKGRNNFISYFDVMPDSIFAKYIARGIKSKNELIISKAERDANPLQCNGENFTKNYDSDPSFGNYVFLSGYTGDTASPSSNSSNPSSQNPAETGGNGISREGGG